LDLKHTLWIFFPIFTITGVLFGFHNVGGNTHLQGNCLTRRFTWCCRLSETTISTYPVWVIYMHVRFE
jgi:hypothetical protein